MLISRREWMALAGCAAAWGQDETATFSAGVKVVNLLATVRTKKGQLLTDLGAGDFQIFENGRPQTVKYFSKETDLPLTIGLLIDTSASQRRVLDSELSACYRFLDQVLRDGKDQVFVMQFDLAVVERQRVTSSHRELEAGLARVDLPSQLDLQRQRGGGTVLYDAVVQASEVMKGLANRKALILLTDGVDTGSQVNLQAAVEAAQKADTLIYAIEFSDATYYGGGEPGGGRVLERLARETGGAHLEVSKKRGVEVMFEQIQTELRGQYSLGYVSDTPVRVSEFRKLELVGPKGALVQTRGRYWAQR